MKKTKLTTDIGLYDKQDVLKLLGSSRYALDVWLKEGIIPPPESLYGKKMYWTEQQAQAIKSKFSK